MQSLADFLQFLLRQPTTATGALDPTRAPLMSKGLHDSPLSVESFAPFGVSAEPLQNSPDQPSVVGPGYIPFSPFRSSTFDSPESAPTSNASSGGILGGLPFVTGGSPDDSRSRGILYTYDDPEQRQVGSLQSQSFDPKTPGRDPTTPIWSSPTAVPRLPTVALPNWPSRGQFTGQSTQEVEVATEHEFPQLRNLVAFNSPWAASFFPPGGLQLGNGVAPPSAFSNAQTYKPFGIDARIYHPENVGSDSITPLAPAQGEGDWSTYLQPAQYVHSSAITGDPHIDRTTQILVDALAEVVKELGADRPGGVPATVFGTHAHSRFAQRVIELDLPGIGQDGIEQSWNLGELLAYGISGSKRTDIYLKDRFGRPVAIYDLKTGNAQLTPARIRELRKAVGVNNIPVIELSWRDIMALHR